MNDIVLGLQLMGIGMVTVFCILLIVIYGSKLIITLINKVAPETAAAEAGAAPAAVSGDVRAILDAAVSQITGGRGHITKITKI